MQRLRFFMLCSLATSIVFLVAGSAMAQKKPGGGSGDPPLTGTVFFFNGTVKAMRPDGTGIQQVLPEVDSTNILFPAGADPTKPYPLQGVPCDQVQGTDPFHDRWYLTVLRTNTYDEIHLSDGRSFYDWPHLDIFAFRTNPLNRSQVVVVRLTDFFGKYLLSTQVAPQWSNDSNETTTSYIGNLDGYAIAEWFELEVREGETLHVVNGLNRDTSYTGVRLPLAASSIEAAWRLGISDLSASYTPYEIDVSNGLGIAAPGGDWYAETREQNRVLSIRSCWDRSLIRVLWDGNLGVAPLFPAEPCWSSDGTRIAFIDNGVWNIPAAGGAPRQLAKNVFKGFRRDRYNSPCWSPDGKYLILKWVAEDDTLNTENWKYALHRVPADGGSLVNITPNFTTIMSPIRWVSNTPSPMAP